MVIGLKQEDTIYSFSNYDLSNCSRWGTKDSFHRQRSPSLEREAYLLRLRRMKKRRKCQENIGYFVFNISEAVVSKASILEGGGPRSGGRSPVP